MHKSLIEDITVSKLLKVGKQFRKRKNNRYAPNPHLSATRRNAIVVDWLKNYSKGTQETYSAAFNRFLEDTNTVPQDILDMGIKDAKKEVKRIAGNYASENKYGSAYNIIDAMMSFCNHYSEQLGGKLEFSHSEKIPRMTTKTYYIPKPQQIYAIANAAQTQSRPNNPRNSALIMTAWVTSLRENALMDLRCGAVMGYVENDCPIPVHVGNERTEIGIDDYWCRDDKILGYGVRHFYTFISKEGFVEIEKWLKWRKQNLGDYDKKDYLFCGITDETKNQQMAADSVWSTYKLGVRASGTGIDEKTTTIHKLRNAYKSVMIDGDCDLECRQAMMGHRGERSEGNYFDYHNSGMARNQYKKADWSIAGTARVDRMDKENMELRAEVRQLRTDLIAVREAAISKRPDLSERLAYLEGIVYGNNAPTARKRKTTDLSGLTVD